MTASIDIIRGLPEHASTLTDISVSAKRHWGYPEKWIKQWLPQLTIDAGYVSENEVWLAVVDDTPVAYYSLKQDGEYLWLDNLWVLPAFMMQGIGAQLFNHALERGRARGVSILKIEADPNAQSFYERMGARKVGENHHPAMDGQPRILPVMEINL